ncbi:MAG: OmpA family protein [Rhodospirillales bacterium]|nr:OmpA family protein [Rhodospirillales bacterium]
MRLRYGLAVAALVLALGSGAAMAQNTSGVYVGAAGGVNLLRDADVKGGAVNSKAEFNAGGAVLGTVGYGFGNGLRLEGELGYRSNGIDKAGGASGSGSMRAFSAMGNVLYDIDTSSPFTPYIGVGLGGARVKMSDGRTFSGTTINDSDTVFAYQGIAGVAYSVAPNIKLGLDYRYFATQDPKFTTNTGIGVESEYRSHTIMIGFRYEFGAPARPAQPAAAPTPPPAPAPAPAVAPPPPPPPPPAIQRSFLVFFDWDKSDITPEASRIIKQAAANVKAGNITRINATGHADRSGPERYNMALSIRRANAVKEALMREGVPANQIAVVGKGETDPLVPTPDGVREPQNRRVEIALQ